MSTDKISDQPIVGPCKECGENFEKHTARAQICPDCKADREDDKRDQWLENWRYKFAGMAMQAFLTASFTDTGGQCVGITGADGKTHSATPEHIAAVSTNYADALLAKLSKEDKPPQEAVTPKGSCI